MQRSKAQEKHRSVATVLLTDGCKEELGSQVVDEGAICGFMLSDMAF